MTKLKGLQTAARVALSEDFRRGALPAVDVSEYVTDLGLWREVDLEPLREVIEYAVKHFDHHPQESDPWLGPRVHATLRLTRREAADKRLWPYLTVVAFPDYVRWRWGNAENEKLVTFERFVGADSANALAKLWWAAEIARNGSDYSLVPRVLKIYRFYIWQKLNCMHHKTCAVAAVEFLCQAFGTGVNESQALGMARALNLRLRTTTLDSLVPSPPTDTEAIREWIGEKIDATTMIDNLPIGPDEAPIPESDLRTMRRFLDDLAERINLRADVRRSRSHAAQPA